MGNAIVVLPLAPYQCWMAPQLALAFDQIIEHPSYVTSQLLTYIGNKRRLLGFVAQGLDRARALLGKDEFVFLDLFAGSGVVARYAKRMARHLIVNDLEPYSAAANRCFLSNAADIDWNGLERIRRRIIEQADHDPKPGFITQLYAPLNEEKIVASDRVFYTRHNATFLDSVARSLTDVASPYRDLLLGPLLSAASMHANTSGVFKGFYKDREGIGKYGGSGGDALTRILKPISLDMPQLSVFNRSHEVHQCDANALIDQLDHVDIAYFDPPYNQHPYGSNYFMLNLLVNYHRPEKISDVSGIPVDWSRSDYNKRPRSAVALFDAVARVNADMVLISYNSEGFVPYDLFLSELLRMGKLEILDTRYNTFRGCRNLHARDPHVTEFLFLLDKR